MREGAPNPDEMSEYLSWRRERLGPKEGPTLRSGDTVRVPRTDGEIDGGWKIRYIWPDENNQLVATVDSGDGLTKDVLLSDLEEVN